ncbi:hypothetical protein E4U56_001639 [Claviceps arundinis]|uniref:Uncharacterized protein n=1 Tax=Claviceps arundinis TaxID=1623583 RepID=A0A9P7SMP4_9HYPO|nr:hypothetical protein E4U56_001639 [Claviceps arundinis]
MAGTRATPTPDAGSSGQLGTASNDFRARLEAIHAQADLLEAKNRIARAALKARRRLEVERQTDPAGLRRSNDHDESKRDEAPLGPQRGSSPADSETFLGENLPQNVIALSNELPGVAAQDIDDIRTGKFDFLNLIRLHPSRGQRPDISGGTIVKDYLAPLVFIHCLQRYTWIYGIFHHKKHPEVISAQLEFVIFIIHQAEIFPWDKCLRYAMDRLKLIRVSNIHDAKLWKDSPLNWIRQYFSYVPPPVTQKRQRTNTSDASGDSSAICYRYNTRRGCPPGNCRRRHVCLGCESTKHIDLNCPRR